MTVKVINVNVGKYEVDSIEVIINKEKTEICFHKKDEVSKLLGKTIDLAFENGIYSIKPSQKNE